jgi:hypothetical protein
MAWHEDANIFRGEICDMAKITWNPDELLDFQTMYQIFSQRRPCVDWYQSHGHNYAKTKVLEAIDALPDTYQAREMVLTYIIVINNATILDVPTSLKHVNSSFLYNDAGEFAPDTEIEFQQVREILTIIKDLKKQIREYFNNIP